MTPDPAVLQAMLRVWVNPTSSCPAPLGTGLLPPRGEGAGVTASLVGRGNTWGKGAVRILIYGVHSWVGRGQGVQLLAGHT